MEVGPRKIGRTDGEKMGVGEYTRYCVFENSTILTGNRHELIWSTWSVGELKVCEKGPTKFADCTRRCWSGDTTLVGQLTEPD